MAKISNLETFLTKAKEAHPNLDFSLVTEYTNNVTKIPVICHKKDYAGREHGIFMITPVNLIHGKSCPKCNGKGFTSDDRKLFCTIKHNGKYDYSKSNFSKSIVKTTVICPKHGEFQINFDKHFSSGCGCLRCSKPVYDTQTFIESATRLHNGLYEYDKTKYTNSHNKVVITCPVHGDFEQEPNAHLRGQGCPKCVSLYRLENNVEELLKSNNIEYIRDFKANWLITESNGLSHIDFYLPKYNIAIECQGKQHFGIGGWNKDFNFEERYNIDKWKKEQCNAKNIDLIYFADAKTTPKKYQEKYIGQIFYTYEDILNYINDKS